MSPDEEAANAPAPSYARFSHLLAARHLETAIRTSKLGPAPAEITTTHPSLLSLLLAAAPWRLLLLQAVWSASVIAASYFIQTPSPGAAPPHTFAPAFWRSHLTISSFITSAVGWALFSLLGFYIKEASARHHEAQASLLQLRALLLQAARQFLQIFPERTWHDRDRERIIAHLAAYPIALKMCIRKEGSPPHFRQLAPLLSPSDIAELRPAPHPNVYCTKVLRSYLTTVETECEPTSCLLPPPPASRPAPPGSMYARNFLHRIIDSIDETAFSILRISQFKPALGYINHLRIFMYLWFFFVPLSFIQNNGWFTILWSLIVTYGISMIFFIATELNDPFGYDLHDIKLNKVSAETSLAVLNLYSLQNLAAPKLVHRSHGRPPLIFQSEYINNLHSVPLTSDSPRPFFKLLSAPVLSAIRACFARLSRRTVGLPVLAHVLWSLSVVVITWRVHHIVIDNGLASPDQHCRWWCVYLPPDPVTTSTLALALFLMIGFWVIDAYQRYWQGLVLWNADLKRYIRQLTLHFCTSCKRGLWHSGDRERILSLLTAIPVAIKLYLRDCRDVSELRPILSEPDLIAIQEVHCFPDYCFHVIYAYLNSASDPNANLLQGGTNPFRETMYPIQDAVWGIENMFTKCHAIRKFPIAHSFTFHLKIFTGIWLMILPLSKVQHDGPFAALYASIIGYCVINILVLGTELADPFGDDPDDISLDEICQDIALSIREVYENAQSLPPLYIRESQYLRSTFEPRSDKRARQSSFSMVKEDGNVAIQCLKVLWNVQGRILDSLPHVPLRTFIVTMGWAVLASFSSYWLSFIWDQSECKAVWRCSPIQVTSEVLSYTGFGLFLMMTFRAKHAISQYETGAAHLYSLEANLRSLSLDIVQTFSSETWHKADLERIVAHIVQIPLSFRDHLLGTKALGFKEREGLLSDEDYLQLEKSSNPVNHCLTVVESYLIAADSADRDKTLVQSDVKVSTLLAKFMLFRMSEIGDVLSKAQSVKKYPNVKSFKRHQHLFTATWLLLLPLGITASSGFYTILWSPLVSYAIIGLDAVASLMEDPYGDHATDLPIEKMCTRMAEAVIEAVNSVKWGFSHHIVSSPAQGEGFLGIQMNGKSINPMWEMPKLEDSEDCKQPFTDDTQCNLRHPREKMGKCSFQAHVLQSVPWWKLLVVIAWTCLAVLFAYFTQSDEEVTNTTGKWQAKFSVSQNLGIYFSFATFLLLSFYVHAAFQRYMIAGKVWHDNLRSICHALLAHWLSLHPAGTWHIGDHDRVVAHIVSIPIALKMELRGTRDLRELKGILSTEDIGRIHCSENMALHCIDVIRSYFVSSAGHTKSLMMPLSMLGARRRASFRLELVRLERAISTCLFVKNVEIAPAATILLQLLVTIWVAVLPLVLAQASGWITIIIMPLISYGILGLYEVAEEIRDPFGNDLNDIDMDKATDEICRDLMFMQKHYKKGYKTLVERQGEEKGSVETRESSFQSSYDIIVSQDVGERESEKKKLTRMHAFKLAFHSISKLTFASLAVWSLGITFLSRSWVERGTEDASVVCSSPWWCTKLVVESRMFKFGGFALFLLLGQRLYDSHERYSDALILWGEEMKHTCMIASNRMFGGFVRGSWHKGDFERIAGHLCGFIMCSAAELRFWESKDEDLGLQKELEYVLEEKDVERVMMSEQKSDYCLDVVRAYVVASEFGKKEVYPSNEVRK